ncbi:adenylate/guanylate cyclase domain-containing protein [uncultured Sulfitobacter sp.]|uniref:adenylate/guanylate cyclase domain-containing protein n=1 Tax=Sulfitobacter sp. SH22 TaxID=3421172 RepID=UPI0025F7A2CB|nr:adenylate/guanylate cyclase domain-containing protein [uncultured Sulfitobacter sp.]
MNSNLVAVLAADVVGYSKLMGDDAKSTLVALKRLRAEIFAPVVASRRGRVVKNMGDGWIVLFGAASDAAACALQIQQLQTVSQLQGGPEIRLRLGVHLGDVVEDEHDIYGDGVNIASRLEQLANPGSIAISDAVFGILDGTLRPSFDDAGERALKNIAKPIRIWTSGSLHAPAQSTLPARDGLRIVVRPLETSDERIAFPELADALTGDLVTFLNATHWLSVSTGDVCTPAYVLSGRIRTQGTRFRLEVKFIDPSGLEMWSDKIDGTLDDVFDWQDRACATVVGRVLATTFDAERRKLDKLSIDQMTASECELRGQLAIDRLDPDAFASALKYSNAAIEKDADQPTALALALVAYLSAVVMGYDEVSQPYAACVPGWCKAAAPLAADHPLLNLALGVTTYSQSSDPTALRIICEQALRQSSSDFVTLTLSGWAYIWIGDYSAALDCLHKARKLGGQSPWALSIQGGLALASLQAGDDVGAIGYAKQGLTVTASYSTLHRILAAAYAHQGQTVAAQHSVATALALNPRDSITAINARNIFFESVSTNRYLDGLRMAGMPE